jgi:hypothetical protein
VFESLLGAGVEAGDDLQVRWQVGLGRAQVERGEQRLVEDDLVLAVERGPLGEGSEQFVALVEARLLGGPGAGVAVGPADSAVGHRVEQRNQRAAAVALVEALVVSAPRCRAVGCGAEPGHEVGGSGGLVGHRAREDQVGVQPKVDGGTLAVGGLEVRQDLGRLGDVLGTNPRQDREQVPQRVRVGRRSVQVRDEHTLGDEFGQDAVDLFGRRGGEFGVHLVGQVPEAERTACEGEGEGDGRGATQGRLGRGRAAVGPGERSVGDDEALAPNLDGVVRRHVQECQHGGAAFQQAGSLREQGLRDTGDNVVPVAPTRHTGLSERCCLYTREASERGGAADRAQEVAGRGERGAPHFARGGLRVAEQPGNAIGEGRAGQFEGLGEVVVGPQDS